MKELLEEYGSIVAGVIAAIIVSGIAIALYMNGTLGTMITGFLDKAV